MEDPRSPGQPDPATITPWTPNVTQLTGMTMIQWEVRFDLGRRTITMRPEEDPPGLGVDDVRVRFRIP